MPPVCRCALCLARLAVHPCTAVVPAVSGLSLSITYDSRHLEWQFSDPLSSNQNKVRYVTKESQGMDLAWGISPKFEGLSDCVCFWHQADVQTALMNVRFEGNNGHDAVVTHSGQCVCARRTKCVASCAPAARQWSASHLRSVAMITVSPAAVGATSNTMIKGAPRATPIRPTKTPIKRHSTIRVGAPKTIDFLHQKNLCDWLRLGFSFEPWQRRIAGPLYGDMGNLYLSRGRIVQQKIGTFRQTPRPVW